MTILSIDHVQLAMPENGEDAARFFYCGLLGLTEVPKPSHLARRGGCWFENDAVKLHLGVEQPFVPAKKAHPALLVSGMSEITAAISKAGFQVENLEQTPELKRSYVSDPFGNRIELIEAQNEPQKEAYAP